MADLNELYQQIILDHNKAPRNFRALPEANRSAEGNNPMCGDRFAVFLRLENDVIREAAFQGSGCAISKAAASIMNEAVEGKTVEEARNLFEHFSQTARTGTVNAKLTKELEVFAVLRKFPMRVKCALLPWRALVAALSGNQKNVSTES